MKIGLDTIAGIRRDSPPTAELIEAWQSEISNGWSIDHLPDGTHRFVREHRRTTPMGEWITVPFQTSPFTASGGATWTQSFASYKSVKYMLSGKTMWVAFYFEGSAVAAAAPTVLRMRVPGNYLPVQQMFGHIHYDDNGTVGVGMVQAVANSPQLEFTTNFRAGVAWTISGNLSLAGQFGFEIQETM